MTVQEPRTRTYCAGDMEVRNWDARYEALRHMLALIGQRLPYLSRRPHDRLLFPCAALARCRRLCLAMDHQRQGGFSDTVGGQLRTVFDTWLNSMWTLLDPDSAYTALASQYKRAIGKMDATVGLGLPGVAGWAAEGRPPDLWSIVQRVAPLLASEEEDPSADTTRLMYNTLHRSESNRGVHGGLGAVIGHLVSRQGRVDIAEARVEPQMSGEAAVIFAGALTAHLGVKVFERCGLSSEELGCLARRIGKPPGVTVS